MLFRPKRQLSFATFSSRPGSRQARAAGIYFASCRHPSQSPVLVLAGREGAGKTHLLHAIARLARDNEYVGSCAILSARRFAEEVRQGVEFGDLPRVLRRFAAEGLLAIDDADQLGCRPEASQTLLRILDARAAAKKRSVLTVSLSATPDLTGPLNDYLNQQPAIRLI